MRRREVFTLLGGAAATWPRTTRAQRPATPVIGYLGPGSSESEAFRATAFRQGLNEASYVEGQNVTVDYRWAEDHHDRLPAMAADLANRQVAVIVAFGVSASLAAAPKHIRISHSAGLWRPTRRYGATSKTRTEAAFATRSFSAGSTELPPAASYATSSRMLAI